MLKIVPAILTFRLLSLLIDTTMMPLCFNEKMSPLSPMGNENDEIE
jgi:hypothetical protein